jgi:predicted N-formylglutamate amidohydrolase
MPPDAAPPHSLHFFDGPQHGLLLLCDHASNRVPPEFGDLGLDSCRWLDHIAWDPGAAGVALAMARALRCPLFLGAWSRLVVDLNRSPDAADLILAQSDGVAVPGNAAIDAAERQRRVASYHRPYHDAIDRHVAQLRADGTAPLLISIHTYTPVFGGEQRPWPVGILWKRHEPWLDGVLEGLRRQGLAAGDNAPYDGRVALGHTLEEHALRHGLRSVLFEVRQDLVATPAQQSGWAERLLAALHHAGLPIDAGAAGTAGGGGSSAVTRGGGAP